MVSRWCTNFYPGGGGRYPILAYRGIFSKLKVYEIACFFEFRFLIQFRYLWTNILICTKAKRRNKRLLLLDQ